MKNKKLNKFLKDALLYLIIYSIIALFIFFKIIIDNIIEKYNIHVNDKDSVIIALFVVIVPLSFIIIFYLIKNRKTIFKNVENETAKITCLFLEELKYTPDKNKETLAKVFPQYSISKINKIFNKVKSKKFDKNTSFTVILKEKHKTRLYLAYILIKIAGFDSLLTIEEETIILNFIRKLKIQKNIFEKIKLSFVKKGLKEERKILAEQNRRKLINQFSKFMLPYEAYRILGVSPSVTKAQLKKAYRTLAKKHHPDKHIGQNAVEIQKAEDKFQEIKEAYEVIKKNKNY